jgi:hypothetical protein
MGAKFRVFVSLGPEIRIFAPFLKEAISGGSQQPEEKRGSFFKSRQ